MEREIQSDVATESTGGHDDQSIIKPGKCLKPPHGLENDFSQPTQF